MADFSEPGINIWNEYNPGDNAVVVGQGNPGDGHELHDTSNEGWSSGRNLRTGVEGWVSNRFISTY